MIFKELTKGEKFALQKELNTGTASLLMKIDLACENVSAPSRYAAINGLGEVIIIKAEEPIIWLRNR